MINSKEEGALSLQEQMDQFDNCTVSVLDFQALSLASSTNVVLYKIVFKYPSRLFSKHRTEQSKELEDADVYVPDKSLNKIATASSSSENGFEDVPPETISIVDKIMQEHLLEVHEKRSKESLTFKDHADNNDNENDNNNSNYNNLNKNDNDRNNNNMLQEKTKGDFITRVVWRRFSQFEDLQLRIKNYYKLNNPQFVDNLPKLPGKAWIWQNHTDTDFLNSRKVGLEEYLRKLLRVPRSLAIPALLEFLLDDL